MTYWYRRASLDLQHCRLLSIDPGSENLALWVADKNQYTLTTILMQMMSLREKKYHLHGELLTLLDSHRPLLSTVQLVVLEFQMAANTDMIIVFDVIVCYFLLTLPQTSVVGIWPHRVDAVLRRPPKNVCKRKPWVVTQAHTYLDAIGRQIISQHKVQHHLADTVTQVIALLLSESGSG